ncbi:MAG: HDOD domain-containing protein [Candidatus Brocadiae bacterium]|nr:HDOD domain-containing protein [Candidatus Brocadiia bacterium]
MTLADVQRRVDSLPTLPEITTFVLSMLEDPASSAPDVTQVLVRDASLSSQILKLVNSAFYGLPQKVSDLTRAIALLGFGRIKTLVLSVSMLRLFRSLSGRRREEFSRFWMHSAVVAGLMRRMALRMEVKEPESAFVLGLVHDAGKLVFLGHFQEQHAAIVRLAEERRASFAAVEGSVFATTHAEVGAWMARGWGLPKELEEAIANHHGDRPWEAGKLAAALHFADHAAKMRGVACAGSCEEFRYDEAAWGAVGLPQEDYFEMMAAADSERALGEMVLRVSGAMDEGAL